MQKKRHNSYSKDVLEIYKRNVPDGVFVTCPKCKNHFYHITLGKYKTCPECNYEFRVPARQRLKMITKNFVEWDSDISTSDPLNFPDYMSKIKTAQLKTQLGDGVLTGRGRIGVYETAIGIMDPFFIMGSLSTASGEKITRLFEKATINTLPVILYTSSGGARMQEGIFSLMQMAKISQVINEHQKKGLLYIAVLMDPTTGGVTASFASQADIIIAEPGSLIGFAGKRVIEQTMNKKVPKDFQSAGAVFNNGFLDDIVPRSQQNTYLKKMLKIFYSKLWSDL